MDLDVSEEIVDMLTRGRSDDEVLMVPCFIALATYCKELEKRIWELEQTINEGNL